MSISALEGAIGSVRGWAGEFFARRNFILGVGIGGNLLEVAGVPNVYVSIVGVGCMEGWLAGLEIR